MNGHVYINNGRTLTTSVLIANKFKKHHKVVLVAIDELIRTAQNCPVLENMTAENSAVLKSMFVESSYINKQNKQQRMIVINRDGFSLLVMGFTGEQALRFKFDFIKAFNQMEAELQADRRAIVPADDVCLKLLSSIVRFGYACKKELENPLTVHQRMHVFTRYINVAGYEFAGLQAELDRYHSDPRAREYYLNNDYNPFDKNKGLCY